MIILIIETKNIRRYTNIYVVIYLQKTEGGSHAMLNGTKSDELLAIKYIANIEICETCYNKWHTN